jgi:hypothetical protein
MHFPTDEEARIFDNYMHRQDSGSILAYRRSRLFLTVEKRPEPPEKKPAKRETGLTKTRNRFRFLP